jgi:hypothetical protein
VLDCVVPGALDLSLRGPSGSRWVANKSIVVPPDQRELNIGTLTLDAPAPPSSTQSPNTARP